MFYLQSRWKIEDGKLIYYGMRAQQRLNKNRIKISKREAKILQSLPCELTPVQQRTVKKLINEGAITTSEPKKTPTSLYEAVFCSQCCANDFMIPGIEFDSDGLCPMCASRNKTADLKSVVPLIDDIPHSKKSRFDVALFYTGGKDSTYILYYLSKVRKLRVLALTWEIPYISDSAKKSIENAKTRFDNVEFVSRKVSDGDMRAIYKKLYSLNENTCACPSLAYALFYPLLVSERVPYFVTGNEPAQLAGLYFNNMAPKIAYKFADNKFINFAVNVGRIITLRPPFKRGQFHTLTTMKQLAYGQNKLTKLAGYKNELVNNVTLAIHEVPSIVKPLKRSIRYSSFTGRIPAFVQIDFDKISGKKYEWTKVKELLVNECGWIAPEDSGKGLHTSCKIEKCKEYSQFIRFYKMRSTLIPFSAIEISIATRDKNISRENAEYEIGNILGFSLEEVPECAIMKEYLKSE